MSSQLLTLDNEMLMICNRIENLIQRDEGSRGIGPLCIPDELSKSASAIVNSEKIVILTGFPCMLDYNPPTETDGPLGALAIARACLAIGKQVILLTDECNEEVVLAGAAASGLFSYNSLTPPPSSLPLEDEDSDIDIGLIFQLESFPGKASFDDRDNLRLQRLMSSGVDCVIAIERAGPSADGSYLTMRKRDMTHLVAPLDAIISQAVVSIGIGDGGNEVGMGKVYDKIVSSSSEILNAKEIACVVATDYLIVASVSNWGGYALAAAIALAFTSSPGASLNLEGLMLERSALMNLCLPSEEQEVEICRGMVAAGARDGITGVNGLYVDGMPLQKSIDVLNDIKGICRHQWH